MFAYWSVMSTVSVPILLACVLGALLDWVRNIETRTLADVSLYVLAPCLVVIALANSTTGKNQVSGIIVFTILSTLLTWGLGFVVSRLMGLSKPSQASMILTTVFSNSNNYGLPVLLLAFGTKGFSLGTGYVVGQVILVNTLGLFIASQSNVSPQQALRQVVKAPLIYAALAGILLCGFRFPIPHGLSSGLHLVGDAYPAIVLLILGVQIRKIRFTGIRRGDVWVAVILRTILVPLVSFAILHIMGVHGLLHAVLFVQSSMPAAINTSVLVEKFGGDKELVALTVAITTIISFITLPLLISIG